MGGVAHRGLLLGRALPTAGRASGKEAHDRGVSRQILTIVYCLIKRRSIRAVISEPTLRNLQDEPYPNAVTAAAPYARRGLDSLSRSVDS